MSVTFCVVCIIWCIIIIVLMSACNSFYYNDVFLMYFSQYFISNTIIKLILFYRIINYFLSYMIYI